MTRPLFLSLLLSLLLTACATSFADATKTAESHVQTRPLLATMEVLSTPVAHYSATANLSGTQAAANMAVTLAEQGRLDGIATETKTVWLVDQSNIAKTETRQPIDRATAVALRETANAAEWLRMTQEGNRATMTYIAPINQATAAQLVTQSNFSDARAITDMIFNFGAGTGILLIGIALVWLAFRPHFNAPTRADNERMPAIQITPNSEDHDTTPPGGNELFAQFLQAHALAGKALGINSVKSNLYPQETYKQVVAWMAGVNNRRIIAPPGMTLPSLFMPGPANNSRVLSPDGVIYYRQWLTLYTAPSPPPLASMGENMTPTPHDRVENDHFGQWGSTGGSG